MEFFKTFYAGPIKGWKAKPLHAVIHRHSEGTIFCSNTRWHNLTYPLPFDDSIQYSLSIYILVAAYQASLTLIVWSLYCIPQYFPTNGILFASRGFRTVNVKISYSIFQYLWQSAHILYLSSVYIKRHINTIYSVDYFTMRLSRLRTASLSIFFKNWYLIIWILFSKQFLMTVVKGSTIPSTS